MPDAVTSDERPQVGELDPLGLLARHVVAREDLGFERTQEGAHRFGGRIQLQRDTAVEHPLVCEQPEGVLRPEEDAPDAERTPPHALGVKHEVTAFAVREAYTNRVVPLLHYKLWRQ